MTPPILHAHIFLAVPEPRRALRLPFLWTDSKIRVHALYCFFALLLLAILRLKLRKAGLVTNVGRAVERLAKVRESVVVYTNGATDRVLMELDDAQQELAQALELTGLAEQLGTTVLKAE